LLPVEILINEHRLIERFVRLIKKEIEKIIETQEVEPNFIVVAVDFFRTYADRYHHGKEEGILFKGLSQKKLSVTDDKMMLELIMEHAYARKTVNNLESFKETYLAGNVDTLKDILQLLKELVELYPAHIEKEDEHFFYPSMKYFTQLEQEDLLNKFVEFDRDFTDKKYQQVIKMLDNEPNNKQKLSKTN
jgi:hemerythrin-like domain-containing protein